MSNLEFTLQMMGVGSALRSRFFNNSALIHFLHYNMLIDCGGTVPMAMQRYGVNPGTLDGIFITHLHGDHVNGLEEIAWEMMYMHKKRIDLIGEELLLEELWENTLKGGLQYTDSGKMELTDFFNVVPLKRDVPMHHAGTTLEIIRTSHIPQKENFSLFIGREFFYSGDVRFDYKGHRGELVRHIFEDRKCKLAFHDCQLHNYSSVHANIFDLLTLPEEWQEKIWLMHYGNNVDDFIGKSGKMRFLEQGKRYDYEDGVLE